LRIINQKEKQFLLICTLSVIVLSALTSCIPFSITQTPDDQSSTTLEGEILLNSRNGQSCYHLPDGSEIFLDQDTLIGLTADTLHHEIVLYRGKVTVISKLPLRQFFTVRNPYGYIARVERITDAVIVITHNNQEGFFIYDCLAGHCQMGVDASSLKEIPAGGQMWMGLYGNFQGPFPALATAPQEMCVSSEEIIIEIPTLSSTFTPELAVTETPTPDELGGTATAACSTFQAEFPGTPCP
jgi:hypothetical protein